MIKQEPHDRSVLLNFRLLFKFLHIYERGHSFLRSNTLVFICLVHCTYVRYDCKYLGNRQLNILLTAPCLATHRKEVLKQESDFIMLGLLFSENVHHAPSLDRLLQEGDL